MPKQNRLLVLLRDPDKKNIFIMIKEVIQLYFKKKEIPYFYFKYLYKKEITNIFDFVGTKEADLIHFHPKLNTKEHRMIMNSKLSFAIYAEKHNLSTPILFGHNYKHNFYYQGKQHAIRDLDGLRDYFMQLLESSPNKALFVKPLMNFGGSGCFKIDQKDLHTQISKKGDILFDGNHVFTQLIEQHSEINKIHRSSINTLRIITFIKDDGAVEIVSSLMRFGIGESEVDNTSAGGMFIGIEHSTGILNPTGLLTMEFGGDKLTHHPTSNFKFGGFKIPYYKEACQLVLDALDYIPERWVGWDVAITPEGPTIIEANDTPSIYMSDLACGGFLKNATVKQLLIDIRKGKF